LWPNDIDLHGHPASVVVENPTVGAGRPRRAGGAGWGHLNEPQSVSFESTPPSPHDRANCPIFDSAKLPVTADSNGSAKRQLVRALGSTVAERLKSRRTGGSDSRPEPDVRGVCDGPLIANLGRFPQYGSE
jgi:hypothetical protein